MKITLSLPDDLYDELVAQAGDDKAIKSFIAERLEATKNYAAQSKAITLSEEQRARLQAITDRTVATADDVVKAFESIVRFDIGEFVYEFPVEDLDALASQAEYWDQPLDEYVISLMRDFVAFGANRA